MRFVILAGALALAASCAPAAQSADAGCGVSVSTPWRPLSGTEFTVEASSMGADCAKAVATIVVRDVQGNALWAQAYSTEHVMVLAPAHDTAAMRIALSEWIDPAGNTTLQTTGALPEWPANAESPQNGEFPFYPDEGTTREDYNAVRDANTPMYCYVQGMESLACAALRDGALQSVGVQTFPG
jgi:hypothetical protein